MRLFYVDRNPKYGGVMRLSKYLERQGMDYSEFALTIGVDKTTIFRILQGSSHPKLSTARKIVAACGGSVTYNDLYAAVRDE
jgi:DNA-binding XRE family transcriptional regulator